MTQQVSTLGLAVDTSGVKKATGDLKEFASAGVLTQTKAQGAAEGINQVDRASKTASASVEATVRALQQQAATLGMTAAEAQMYKLRTADATTAQLALAQAALKQISVHAEKTTATQASIATMREEAAASWQQHQAIESVIGALRTQVAMLGMTAQQAQLYTLSINGATQAQLAEAKVKIDLIAAHRAEVIAKEQSAAADLRAQAAMDAKTSRIAASIQAMRTQVATMDMSSASSEIYRLRMEGATASQIRAAEGYQAQIAAHQRLTAATSATSVVTAQSVAAHQAAAAAAELHRLRLTGASAAQIRAAQTTLASAEAARVLASAQASAAASTASLASSSAAMTAGLGAMNFVMRALPWAFVAQQSVSAAMGLSRIGDEATNLEGRLKLTQRAGEDLATTQATLYSMAQRTGSAYASTVELYSKVSAASKELGASQQQAFQFTEAVANAFRISGSNAQQVQAGVMQLGQALQGGTVRAEEFNSMQENGFRLVQAAAEGMGLTFGELRAKMIDGKVTSEEFFAAILKSSEKLKDEVDKIGPTAERSATTLMNAFKKAISQVDKDIGATTFFSKLLSGAAAGVDTFMEAQTFIAEGQVRTKKAALEAEVAATEAARAAAVANNASAASIAGIDRALAQGRAALAQYKGAVDELDKRGQAKPETSKSVIGGLIGPVAGELKKREEERAKFAKDYQTKASKYAEEMAKAEALYAGHIPPEVLAGIKEKYKSVFSGDTKAQNEAKRRAERAEREAEQVANKNLAGKLDEQKDNISGAKDVYSFALQEAQAYRSADLTNEQQYLAATKSAREAYKATTTEALNAEEALLFVRLTSTKDASSRAQVENQINDVTRQRAALTRELNQAEKSEELRLRVEAEKEFLQVMANADPLEKRRQALEKINALLERGTLKQHEYAIASAKIEKDFTAAMRKARKEAGDTVDYSEIAGNSIGQAIGEVPAAIVSGNLKDLGKSFENMFVRIMQQAIQAQLMIALLGSTNPANQGGGILGPVISGLSGIFGGSSYSYSENAAGDISIFNPYTPPMADGGSTRKNSIFPVNERGTELYQEGGKSWLLAGDDGHVTSAEQLAANASSRNGTAATSAAPKVSLSVQVNGSQQYEASQSSSQQPDGSWLIELVLDELDNRLSGGGSRTNGILESKYGLNAGAGAM